MHPITRCIATSTCAIAVAATMAMAPQTVSAAPPPGEIVVKVDPTVDVPGLLARHDATLLDTVLASRGIYLLGVPWEDDGKDDAWKKAAKDILKDFEDEDGVRYAEVNHDAHTAESVTSSRFYHWPSDERPEGMTGAEAWMHQDAVGVLGLEQVRELATGRGVRVAVLDTGIDLDHPALADRIEGGYDYVDDDEHADDVGNGVDDDGDGFVDESLGHGTHAAGVVHLVAPGATLLPYRVIDSDGRGSVFTVAEAILDAVADGADVVNLSFGVEGDVDSKVLEEAFDVARKAEVVVVAAAGNAASEEKHYPAADKHVIAVAALDTDGTGLAEFSNRGDWIDVAAPGSGVVSTVPGGYGTWSGTSFAAPIVAGEAALLRELDPDKMRKSKDVLKAIEKATRKLEGDDGKRAGKGAVDLRFLIAD